MPKRHVYRWFRQGSWPQAARENTNIVLQKCFLKTDHTNYAIIAECESKFTASQNSHKHTESTAFTLIPVQAT